MWCEKEIDTSVYDITVLNNIIASNIVDVSGIRISRKIEKRIYSFRTKISSPLNPKLQLVIILIIGLHEPLQWYLKTKDMLRLSGECYIWKLCISFCVWYIYFIINIYIYIYIFICIGTLVFKERLSLNTCGPLMCATFMLRSFTYWLSKLYQELCILLSIGNNNNHLKCNFKLIY